MIGSGRDDRDNRIEEVRTSKPKPGLSGPARRLISTALMVFNDVILRVGIESGLTIIDLRLVCSSADDYANPIEPSSI